MFNEAFESRNVDDIYYHYKIVFYAIAQANHIYMPSSTGLTPCPIHESTQIPMQE